MAHSQQTWIGYLGFNADLLQGGEGAEELNLKPAGPLE
jgi:hypothetical protein